MGSRKTMKGADDMVKINIAQDFNDVLGGDFIVTANIQGKSFLKKF